MKTLIIVDVQQDFLPGGSLGVPHGDEIVPVINELISSFDHILATKDWHPKGHISFASSHDKPVGALIQVYGSHQILWPDHCVQDTPDADFAKGLETGRIESVFKKGVDPKVDSYSAFFDHSKKRSTGLEAYLREHRLNRLYFVGLATDYCVLYSVLDALNLGFNVTVVRDACRAINLDPNDEEKSISAMKLAGAKIVFANQISSKKSL